MSGIARAQPQARAAHGEQQQLTQDDQCRASADRSLGAALDASLAMAQAALSVRGAAIAALLDEVAALRSENDVIAASITDPGLSALRQRLQYLEAELAEERSARQAVERELAETAEATYEMWDAFRDWMGSESRAGTSLYSRDSSPGADDEATGGGGTRSTGWRTPPMRRGATPPPNALSPSPLCGGPAALSPTLPSPRGGVPASDPSLLEQRVVALAGRLQGKELLKEGAGRADVNASRDRQRAGTSAGGSRLT